MEADITIVAEDQIGLVRLQAAALAHGAVQTTPALLKDHFGYLEEETKRYFFDEFC